MRATWPAHRRKKVAVVAGEGFDPDAVEQGGGADAVAVGVGEGDAAHGADACVVEGLESAQEVFAQAPDLAVVRQEWWVVDESPPCPCL